MSKAEYEVPEGMLKAACNDTGAIGVHQRDVQKMLLAAVRWLAENPIVPSKEDISVIATKAWAPNETCVIEIGKEFQRRMFLKRDITPEELKPLLYPEGFVIRNGAQANELIRKAYELGNKAGTILWSKLPEQEKEKYIFRPKNYSKDEVNK
jgi:hypothetical protein